VPTLAAKHPRPDDRLRVQTTGTGDGVASIVRQRDATVAGGRTPPATDDAGGVGFGPRASGSSTSPIRPPRSSPAGSKRPLVDAPLEGDDTAPPAILGTCRSPACRVRGGGVSALRSNVDGSVGDTPARSDGDSAGHGELRCVDKHRHDWSPCVPDRTRIRPISSATRQFERSIAPIRAASLTR
jgi:hypothetical protein